MRKGGLRISFGRAGIDTSRIVAEAMRKLGDPDKNKEVIGGMTRAGGYLCTNLRRNLLSVYRYSANDNPTRRPSLYSSIRQRSKRGFPASRRYVGFERSGGEHGALAHLVDGGTTERYTKAGLYRGRMPQTDFARRAFNSSVRGMYSRIVKGFEQALRKL